MQIDLYCKILLLTAIWLLCGIEDVFCAETRGPIIMQLLSLEDSGQRGISLWAHGDYTKLKLIIRSSKKDYVPGELVEVMFFVRNDSDHEIHVLGPVSIENGYSFGRLFYSNYNEVPMIDKWGNIRLNLLNDECEVFREYLPEWDKRLQYPNHLYWVDI